MTHPHLLLTTRPAGAMLSTVLRTGLAIVLLLAAAPTTVTAAGISAYVQALPAAEATEAPSLPDGENQSTLADGSEICCQFTGSCAPSGGPYSAGETITLNSYWTDTLPNPVPDVDWVVDWTLGVRVPNGNIVQLFTDQVVSFGRLDGFAPGTVVRFCVAGILTLPNGCEGGASLTHGHGATTPTGTLPAGPSDPVGSDDTFVCN